MTTEELKDCLNKIITADIPVYANAATAQDKPPDTGYLVVTQSTSRPMFRRESDYPISETQAFMLHAYALKNDDMETALKVGETAALSVRNFHERNLYVRFGTRTSGHDTGTKRARFTATRLLTVRHANTV